MTTSRPTLRPHAGRAAALALAALLLAGCTGAGTDSSSAGGADAEAPAAAAESAAYDAGAVDRATGSTGERAAPATLRRAQERTVVSTGTVSLESDDVGAARFDVQRVVDEVGGEVSDEQTGTDRDGEVRRTRLVLRVPSAAFDETMTALAALDSATLRSAKRVSEDVTTQVIDVAARVRAQEASLQRVELLLARAERLRDVVAVEAQLTRRQADLDSLKQQQAFLADQTALATVTVLVERPEDRPEPAADDDGFLAGLGAGWDALQGSTVAVLTAVGAVLPFLVVLALLGVPAWLVLRRWAPHRTAALSEGAAARTP
ncbi:DUF4349 domain-containing protein [Nocardioides perillae]|uniref:Putative small secreted protein n=1 Tax=Nocardioides perillae TaxID=1119534 RepID=A0A7Y9RUJ3_9ACTN|nr:DUF4349 domain-containing protein [Nocardioides perillae]NYG56886.1 putative small secreted protein [Nocardioides perillae]